MEIKSIINNLNQEVYYVSWEVNNPSSMVVISHGMAEHPKRYDALAKYLNDNGISVYAIYHIGHGEYATKLGHMGKNEFDQCVDNINYLIESIKKDVKVFLLGHSMGSFISQLYISKYNNIDGLILSGSNNSTVLFKMGSVVSSLICAFSKDDSVASPFLDNLSFGSFNNMIKDPKTKFDWLSRDEKEVQKYIDDPYCGFVCSKGFFKNLTKGTATMANKNKIKNINKELPILILGGSNDPVSSNGKGLKKLYEQYKKLNIKNVSLKIYDGARHEIYNEINKEEVYNDTLEFIYKFQVEVVYD